MLLLCLVFASALANFHYAEHLAFTNEAGAALPGTHQATDTGEHEIAHQYCEQCQLLTNLLAVNPPALALARYAVFSHVSSTLSDTPGLALFEYYESRAPPRIS